MPYSLKCVISLVLLYAASTLAQNFICPGWDDPPCPNAYYPDPRGNCSVFYQCSEACIAYKQECATGLHFDPDLGYCVLPIDYPCEDSVISQPGVFMVWRDSDINGSLNPVDFQEELDRANSFGMANSMFQAHSNGIYFFTFSTGFLDSVDASTYISSASGYVPRVDIMRTSAEHNDVDMTSRDVIYGLSEGDFLRMTAIDGGLASSLTGAETSMAGFSLHDTMNTLLSPAFSVSKTFSLSTLGTITYNSEITNIGRMINLNTGVFVPERDGNYYFSFSVGVDSSFANSDVVVQLTVDGVPKAELTRQHSDYLGVDTISRSVMLQVNDSQEVTLELVSGEIFGNDYHLICFNAFLYNPSSPDEINPMNATAWSAQRSSSYSAITTEVLTFDNVEVNQGGIYNPTSGEATVEMAGYYYVTINAAAMANEPVAMHIVVNGDIKASLTRLSTVHGGPDSMARSAIVELEEGDVIRAEIGAGTSVYSDEWMQTSFSGFMIINR